MYLADNLVRPRVIELAVEIEKEDRKGYAAFRDLVKSKMCGEFSDTKDITIAVLKTLGDFAHKPALQGAGGFAAATFPTRASS